MKLVQLKQHFFLLPTPRFLADWRVQVVVPALPALLARPFTHWTLLLQPLRYLRPIIKPVLLHQLLNGLILLNYASNTSKVQDCLLMPIIFIIILSLLAQRPRISSTSLKISFKRMIKKKHKEHAAIITAYISVTVGWLIHLRLDDPIYQGLGFVPSRLHASALQ